MDENKAGAPSFGDDSHTTTTDVSHSYSPGHGYGEPDAYSEGKSRPMSGSAIVAIFLVGIILAAALGSTITLLLTNRRYAERSAEQAAWASGEMAEEESAESSLPVLVPADSGSTVLSAEDMYSLASAQVVGVRCSAEENTEFLRLPVSGFVLTDDGYILTVCHGVESTLTGGGSITVTTDGGGEYDAELVGMDPAMDVAVLKINADGLQPAVLGDSRYLTAGQTLFAGSRGGDLCELTAGTVTSLENGIALSLAPDESDFGGPVYNASGQAVGIVCRQSDGQTSVCVPMTEALSAANDIIANGYVSGSSYMGLTLATVSASAAQYYNMVVGAYVYSVEEGSGAEAAGLRIGDIITAVGETETPDANTFVAALRQCGGETVIFSVFRNQQTIYLSFWPNAE